MGDQQQQGAEYVLTMLLVLLHSAQRQILSCVCIMMLMLMLMVVVVVVTMLLLCAHSTPL